VGVNGKADRTNTIGQASGKDWAYRDFMSLAYHAYKREVAGKQTHQT